MNTVLYASLDFGESSEANEMRIWGEKSYRTLATSSSTFAMLKGLDFLSFCSPEGNNDFLNTKRRILRNTQIESIVVHSFFGVIPWAYCFMYSIFNHIDSSEYVMAVLVSFAFLAKLQIGGSGITASFYIRAILGRTSA